MGHTPTPDEAESALFFIKWWKEFFLGAGALLGVYATIKKGQKVPVITALSENQIDTKIELATLKVRSEVAKDFKNALTVHATDLKEHMDLMIKASKK